MKLVLGALAYAVALLVCIPSMAAQQVIETATGQQSVPAEPQIVAVYDIAAADTLAALGVTLDGLPQKVFVDYLDAEVSHAQPVGTIFQPDFEALHALNPDLIIAGGRSSSQVDALSRIAPTIDMTIWGDGLVDQTLQRLAAYGKLFGMPDRSEQLTDDLLQAVADARAAVAGKGNGLIIMTNGSKISAYGPGSRFGWLHTEIGIEPAADRVTASTHGDAISFEFIHKVDPDWLIVIDRSAAIGSSAGGAKQTLDNRLVTETKAWKSDHVIYLNPAKIYVAAGGYQAMRDTLAEIVAAFSTHD